MEGGNDGKTKFRNIQVVEKGDRGGGVYDNRPTSVIFSRSEQTAYLYKKKR